MLDPAAVHGSRITTGPECRAVADRSAGRGCEYPDSGRALEMNTKRLWPWIPQWWAEEGGIAVSFGSDAHGPDAVAANFPEAIAMVGYFGFRPGPRPEDFWKR